MRKCPACNAVIENERAKFCKKCGARLAPEVSLSNDEENTHAFSPNNGVDPHDDDDVAVVGHSRGGIPLAGMSSAGNAGVEKHEEEHNVHFHKPKPYNRLTPMMSHSIGSTQRQNLRQAVQEVCCGLSKNVLRTMLPSMEEPQEVSIGTSICSISL